ncbi:Probable membrane transport protein [Mycobacteroides abscessus subsp. abscessus]|uniref:MFS transporter n=1 Tax=Mycobacteroides abscessus TaxID=36809 RepID=UPI0009A8DEA6|nr:MFS transporter [Mycobacteroides abscessus]SLE58271.1 Probable membrane transport protein [Mycobacteroides abscessus subsp. abscessus]SLE85663.1 Probable membrane transport protein [Mycobacteroides abscessus subsp. abscessus]SLF57946.1 Probable membrane transport protein [Mycobacteroides abscessus subsp. abscessus]SLG45039.1 Probable membrane transport protein [Mycobacteroides abscessus subsp. abscessus]
MTSSPAEPRQMADGQVSPRRVFMASAVGSAIEFYDFYIYGTAAALVFPAVFFPNLSHSLALFASIATFSTAFLARPIGAALFGHYGDRFSRKGTLVVTLITMGLATMAVGLVPGAATIGAAAPTAIVILRLVQGLAVGGEWSGAALLSAEYSPSQNRGRAATAVPIGTSTGLLLSSLVFLIVSLTIGEDSPAFLSWGWRVPFIASGLLVAVGLYIRLQIAETPQFVEAKAHHQLVKSPLRHVITESPRTLVLTSGTMLIIFTLSFMTNTYFPGFARSELHFSRAAILAAGALGAVVLMVSATAGGILSDRLGRRTVILSSMTLTLLWTLLVTPLLTSGPFWAYLAAMALTYVLFGLAFGPMASFLPESYPVGTRYSGTGVAFNVAGVFGGAIPPLIAGPLQNTLGSWAVGLMLLVICAISVASISGMRETWAGSAR